MSEVENGLCPICSYWAGDFASYLRDGHHKYCPNNPENSERSNMQPAEAVQADDVNHPSHYTAGAIECIDAIKASLSPEAYQGFLRGTILKYIWRGPHKGSEAKDYRKAKWYLERLIDSVGGDVSEDEENDMASRFARVIDRATGGKASNIHYDLEVYYQLIDERQREAYEDGYQDAEVGLDRMKPRENAVNTPTDLHRET